jgi:hypothetical protein
MENIAGLSAIKENLQASDVKINNLINFKISYKGSLVPFWLEKETNMTLEMAEAKIQKFLEIIAAQLAVGQNLIEISQALSLRHLDKPGVSANINSGKT